MTFRPALVLVAAATLFATACHGGSGSSPRSSGTGSTPTSGIGSASTTTTTVPLGAAIVFSAQGRQLDAYATTRPFAAQTVVHSPAADRNGVDVSGQICFDPTDPRRFVAVDRTAAAEGQLGWGVFELSGHALGKFSAKETARLVPTFQRSRNAPLPYGCNFLPDGRLLTTDVGNRAAGPPDGQLLEWFPPFDQDTVVSCKVMVTLAAPEGVLVDNDHVYVAEARGGVTAVVTSTLPTSSEPTGGCARHDTTGAPLALGVVQSQWLRQPGAHALTAPTAIARASNGDFYVSSATTGVIAEIDGAGNFVRRVLAPPAGQVMGARPFTTGAPFGLAVDPHGTLYYADTGLIRKNGSVVAGLRTGTVRRITFVNGAPLPPEVVETGLEAPDGIGIWIPSR